jgi:hypothetical protein
LTPIWAYRSPLKISKIGWVCALTFGLKGLRNDHTYKMVTTPKERKGTLTQQYTKQTRENCYDCPVPVGMFLTVLSWQSCTGVGPVLAVLYCQYYIGSPVPAVCYKGHLLPVPTVLFCIQSSACTVQLIPFWLSPSGSPLLTVLSLLSCSNCPVLAVLYPQPLVGIPVLSAPHPPVLLTQF